MANMIVSGAVGIVALTACVTPALACATEFLMTDAEIAPYKNGGPLSGEVAPPQMTAPLQMMAPNLSEPSKPDTLDDVIVRAGSSLLAQGDAAAAPEIAPAPAPAPVSGPAPAPQAAPARELAQGEPARKRVVVTCSGGVYPESDVL